MKEISEKPLFGLFLQGKMENEVNEKQPKSSLKGALKQPKGILKNNHSHSNVNTHPYENSNKKMRYVSFVVTCSSSRTPTKVLKRAYLG